MTQTELAAKTGRSTAYVNQLITGHKKPSPEWVELIADTLKLSPEQRQASACRRRQAARLQARPDQEIVVASVQKTRGFRVTFRAASGTLACPFAATLETRQ